MIGKVSIIKKLPPVVILHVCTFKLEQTGGRKQLLYILDSDQHGLCVNKIQQDLHG